MELVFDLDDLDTVAAEILRLAQEKKVFALHGEMGAGKTTMVRAFCRLLMVEDNITSPTFSLINEYRSEEGNPVFHIDLYRLSGPVEAERAGISDIVESGSYCFVEWPEKAPELFSHDVFHIHLFSLGDNLRKLQINL